VNRAEPHYPRVAAIPRIALDRENQQIFPVCSSRPRTPGPQFKAKARLNSFVAHCHLRGTFGKTARRFRWIALPRFTKSLATCVPLHNWARDDVEGRTLVSKRIQQDVETMSIAVVAFHAGANGISWEEGIAQIDANHQKAKKEKEAERAIEIGQLEAQERTLTELEKQGRDRWEQMRLRHKEDPPRVLVPLALLIVGLLMVSAEATLLAPALDMLGISDPLWQLAIAATTSLGSAVLMHLALEAHEKRSESGRPLLCFAGGLLVFLVVYGIWRAKALTFSATHSRNPIAPFLAESPLLTNFVISALTVVIPVAAAFAAHYALHHLWQWWEFGKANRNAKRLMRSLDAAAKQLEAAKEKLVHDLEVLEHQNSEWQAQYKHYWQLGHENGAKKGPVWPVWVKSAAVALGVMSVGLALSLFGLLGAAVGGGIAGIAAGLASAAHFYHRWEHPTPEQFLRNANTRFTDNGARQEVRLSTITLDEPEQRSPVSESQRRELVQSAKGGA
jgi:hypothetical protein